MKLRLSCIFLLFILSISSSFATDYYLSPTGDNNNVGTSITTPWQTLQKINNTIFQPGDRILLQAGGVWEGQLWPKGSGVSGNPIIIDQYGTGNKPIINGNGTTFPATLVKGAVMLYNQSYWEINNLEVTNYHETLVNARAGILIMSVSATIQNHIYIRNCYVHDVNANPSATGSPTNNKNTGGIIIFGSSIDENGNYVNVNSGFNDVLVENCKVYNVTKEGIRNKSDNNGAYPRVNSNLVFRNNHVEKVFGDGIVMAEIFEGGRIENNYVKNVAYTNSANYAGIWTHYSTGTIIQFNEVCDIPGGMNDGEAFDADNNCNGDIFQYNYSHNNKGGFFLIMPTAQNIIVRYNISQNDGNGTELFHYTSNTYPNNLIYNNTFYIGYGVSTTIFKDDNNTRTVKFFNNIIQADGTVSKFADNPFSANSYFANNCFYPSSITAINGPASHPGLISLNPLLNNPADLNQVLNQVDGFKPQAGSPIINVGININQNGNRDYLNTDLYIDNQADIGAIEYATAGSPIGNSPSMGLIASADSYVRNGDYASQNFGSAATLNVKKDDVSWERESYLKFELNRLTTAPQNGQLKLYISSGDTDVATNVWKLYLVNDHSWRENTINWNNKPQQVGITEIATANGNTAGNYLTFDVGTALIDAYNHSKIISFKIVSTTKGSKTSVDFASKENLFTQFSPQLIFDNMEQLLPVKFKYFHVKRNGQQIKINWETASETKLSQFIVQKSTDAKSFSTLIQIKANNRASNYFANDYSPENGVNYYRVQTVDLDGKIEYTNLAQVNYQNGQLQLKMKAGNTDNETQFDIYTDRPQTAVFVLTNAEGKINFSKKISLQAGANQLTTSLRSNGLHIASVQTASEKTVVKFMVK